MPKKQKVYGECCICGKRILASEQMCETCYTALRFGF